jgi:hypothetical protein
MRILQKNLKIKIRKFKVLSDEKDGQLNWYFPYNLEVNWFLSFIAQEPIQYNFLGQILFQFDSQYASVLTLVMKSPPSEVKHTTVGKRPQVVRD